MVEGTTKRSSTHLEMTSRKDFLLSISAATLMNPAAASAFSQQLPYDQVEQSQLPTNGKLDLNSAFVVRHIMIYQTIFITIYVKNDSY